MRLALASSLMLLSMIALADSATNCTVFGNNVDCTTRDRTTGPTNQYIPGQDDTGEVLGRAMAHMRACTRLEKLMANPEFVAEMKQDPEGRRMYWWYYGNCDVPTPEEKEQWDHTLDCVGPSKPPSCY